MLSFAFLHENEQKQVSTLMWRRRWKQRRGYVEETFSHQLGGSIHEP